MSVEWRLFDPDNLPYFVTDQFFRSAPWVPPEHQRGHGERIQMVADLVAGVMASEGFSTLSDLGCGDGSLLVLLGGRGKHHMWGYDLGSANIRQGRAKRLNVYQADIFKDPIRYGDLVVMTEVLEHLIDPHGFLRNLPVEAAVFSSPWDEDDVNHYSEHSWAWDQDGYIDLMSSTGWTVKCQVTCPEGFQAVYVRRTDA